MPATEPTDELVTASGAGKSLNLTPAAVRMRARAGHLPVAVIVEGRIRLFSRRAIEELARRERHGSR